MFLAEPPQTAYDFHFQLLGFDVRVSPFFWAMAILLGWEISAGINKSYEARDEVAQAINAMSAEDRAALPADTQANLKLIESNPGTGMLLLLWIAAVFVSILIHELGHALAMRHYGIHSRIVLYHFGGLAIPDSASSFMSTPRRGDSTQQIVISAAGPAAQLGLAALVIAFLLASNSALAYQIPYLGSILPLTSGDLITSLPLMALLFFLIMPSIFWALLNLLPVYPLDGGQIARELFTIFSPNDGIKNSLILSIATGALVAVYGLSQNNTMLGIMFGMLAFSSYQVLQAYSGRGGGFGRW